MAMKIREVSGTPHRSGFAERPHFKGSHESLIRQWLCLGKMNPPGNTRALSLILLHLPKEKRRKSGLGMHVCARGM